jgi:NAD(P)-dependent dehydrogenase (short-subunit alcohol dehydrogenase family)
MEHAAAAREDILADSRNAGPVPDPAGRLIPLHVDFEDFETIPKFVEAFHATGLPLHVLVNNAGIHLKLHKKVRQHAHLLYLRLFQCGGSGLAIETRHAKDMQQLPGECGSHLFTWESVAMHQICSLQLC